MLCAIVATLMAAFFFYEPVYSLYVSKPLEIGELILFAVAASIGAKCMAELTRGGVPTDQRKRNKKSHYVCHRDVPTVAEPKTN
jgi:K+-sensing histidine kinase KdpD